MYACAKILGRFSNMLQLLNQLLNLFLDSNNLKTVVLLWKQKRKKYSKLKPRCLLPRYPKNLERKA